jgi:hypothetical protein
MGRAEVHGSSSGGGTSSLGYLLGGDAYSPNASRPPSRPMSYAEDVQANSPQQPSPHAQPMMLSAQHGEVEYYADAGGERDWNGPDDITNGQVPNARRRPAVEARCSAHS